MIHYFVLYGRCSNGRGFIVGEDDHKWGVCKDIGGVDPRYSFEEIEENQTNLS